MSNSDVWVRRTLLWLGGGFRRRFVVRTCVITLIASLMLRNTLSQAFADGDPVPLVLLVAGIVLIACIDGIFLTLASITVSAVADKLAAWRVSQSMKKRGS